jgi:hypothetical protein
MQKTQSFTIQMLMNFCMNELGLDKKKARYTVNILNSPRAMPTFFKDRRSDCRGNFAAKGHLYYVEKVARKFVAGVKMPQYFRLRWRIDPLPAHTRKHNVIKRSGEKVIVEKIVEPVIEKASTELTYNNVLDQIIRSV